MATVTHYIYSHYDPKDREALQVETGQIPEDVAREPDSADPWQTESSFGPQRRLAAAPRFVPATIPYDQINNMMELSEVLPQRREEKRERDGSISGWYRSLTQSTPSSTVPAGLSSLSASSAAPAMSETSSEVSSRVIKPKPEQLNKNNWFISKVIRSEPSSGRSTPNTTLADILSREPPPEPTEKPFTPPVFLSIGPSNKGFAMLQQSGWSEGEALGAGIARRAVPSTQQKMKKPKSLDRQIAKTEEREYKLDSDGEVSEVRRVEVVDLTLSDSDDTEVDELPSPSSETHPEPHDHLPSHNPTALLTPIATVLKSDRLGIGLKAKTVGPYKESKKRVTHNAAALAAHIKANEEMKKMKRLYGRGSKSFTRIAKAQTESRRRLLASLNEG